MPLSETMPDSDLLSCLRCYIYKLKLLSNNLRILAQSSLVVVLAIKLDFELRLVLNKHTRLIYTN
jgi:hypothetical protein